jgi:hypothetical protein
VVASAIAALAVGGCDAGAPESFQSSRGIDAPPLQVGALTATVDYDGNDRPVVDLVPPSGEGALLDTVTTSASFTLHFDRFVLPASVARQAVCLRPQTTPVATINDCQEPFQPFAEPEYDPVLRRVTFRLPAGDRLDADTLYRLTVFPPPDEDGNGFRAFDGAPLARSYAFDFRTQAPGGPALDEPLPTRERYCAAIDCFRDCGINDTVCRDGCRPLCIEPQCLNDGDLAAGALFRSCAFGECHAPAAPTAATPDPTVIAGGLNLFDARALRETAIGMVARQTQQGEQASIPDRNPRRFGRAMPIIDPGNPGNSYLVYKLVANELNHFRPDAVVDAQLVAEIGRLRASVVVGAPMPAEFAGGPTGFIDLADDPDGRASQLMVEAVGQWIAHGAVTECP